MRARLLHTTFILVAMASGCEAHVIENCEPAGKTLSCPFCETVNNRVVYACNPGRTQCSWFVNSCIPDGFTLTEQVIDDCEVDHVAKTACCATCTDWFPDNGPTKACSTKTGECYLFCDGCLPGHEFEPE